MSGSIGQSSITQTQPLQTTGGSKGQGQPMQVSSPSTGNGFYSNLYSQAPLYNAPQQSSGQAQPQASPTAPNPPQAPLFVQAPQPAPTPAPQSYTSAPAPQWSNVSDGNDYIRT